MLRSNSPVLNRNQRLQRTQSGLILRPQHTPTLAVLPLSVRSAVNTAWKHIKPPRPPVGSSTTMQSAVLLLLVEALLLQPLSALHIGKSSPCYSACDGDDLTVTQDLSCIDAAYDEDTGTGAGKRMRECLACTERSDYANSSDTATDQYWFMCMLSSSSTWAEPDGILTLISQST